MPAPAAPAAENGAPRTELQELQFKAGQVTDEVSALSVSFLHCTCPSTTLYLCHLKFALCHKCQILGTMYRICSSL